MAKGEKNGGATGASPKTGGKGSAASAPAGGRKGGEKSSGKGKC
jgi:hypothetical protein